MTDQAPRPASAAKPLWALVIIVVLALIVGGIALIKKQHQDAEYRKYARSDCRAEGLDPVIDSGFDACVKKAIDGFKANGGVGQRY